MFGKKGVIYDFSGCVKNIGFHWLKRTWPLNQSQKVRAEIAKKRAEGPTLTQLWRPEAPKNVHGVGKADEKQANVLKRDEKESK